MFDTNDVGLLGADSKDVALPRQSVDSGAVELLATHTEINEGMQNVEDRRAKRELLENHGEGRSDVVAF